MRRLLLKAGMILGVAVIVFLVWSNYWVVRTKLHKYECRENMGTIVSEMALFCGNQGRVPTSLDELARYSRLPRTKFVCPSGRRGADADSIDSWSSYKLLLPDCVIPTNRKSPVVICCVEAHGRAGEAFGYNVGYSNGRHGGLSGGDLAESLNGQTDLGFRYACRTNSDGRLDIEVSSCSESNRPQASVVP